jgi:hypothetical protein
MWRSQISWARVNPRTITAHARKLLKENLKKVGLMGPALVWNEQLGELLSGHKRLETLDVLERDADYEIDMTVVSLDRATHDAQLNFVNNLNAQGQYDYVQLGDMFAADPKLARAAGFDKVDVSAMFPADTRFGSMFEPAAPIPEVQRDVADLEKLREQRRKAKAAARERDALDFHLVLVAQDGATLQRLLRELGADHDARYVDAERVLRLIGETHASE